MRENIALNKISNHIKTVEDFEKEELLKQRRMLRKKDQNDVI